MILAKDQNPIDQSPSCQRPKTAFTPHLVSLQTFQSDRESRRRCRGKDGAVAESPLDKVLGLPEEDNAGRVVVAGDEVPGVEVGVVAADLEVKRVVSRAPREGGTVQTGGIPIPGQDVGIHDEAGDDVQSTGEKDVLGQSGHLFTSGRDGITLKRRGKIETSDRALRKLLQEPLVAFLHHLHLTLEFALTVIGERPIGEFLGVGGLESIQELLQSFAVIFYFHPI